MASRSGKNKRADRPDEYDLVVLGAGPAGERGATAAAFFGRRVAIVEREPQPGGAVANTGTLPSKTLRETALALSGLRTRDLYGVDLSLRRAATIADLMSHEKRVVSHERERILANLRAAGVDRIQGEASFLDPHTLRVGPGGRLLRARVVLIATGSSPVRPPGFPFEDPRVRDSDGILRLEHLPRRLAVAGAGVIGCEYACTFAALGTEVHLVDGRTTLLPFLDGQIVAELTEAMRELGIVLHLEETVARCEPRPDALQVALSGGAVLECDALLVAAGRQSNTAALDLAAAGLEAGPRGLLTVDRFYRTNVRHIYAAGDVIGFPALASTSMEQARVAMCHAFEVGLKKRVSPILPTGLYTIPEVSAAGATEEELKKKRVPYVAGTARYHHNARGDIIGARRGFLKLLFRKGTGRLLGVHALGESATEVVHVGLMALLTGCDWSVFNRACFNYPTLGQLYKDAMIDALVKASKGRGRASTLRRGSRGSRHSLA
jgi:NAD(P) transhydrogenase